MKVIVLQVFQRYAAGMWLFVQISHQDPRVEWIARESSCSIERTGEKSPDLCGDVVITARSEGHLSKCINMLLKTFPVGQNMQTIFFSISP